VTPALFPVTVGTGAGTLPAPGSEAGFGGAVRPGSHHPPARSAAAQTPTRPPHGRRAATFV